MNWFAQKRQEWIGESLKVYGFINRFHLQRKFGISHAQAAIDFRAFNEKNPDAMQYDNRKKIYYAKDAPKALLDNT
jgi:hypothetical protein